MITRIYVSFKNIFLHKAFAALSSPIYNVMSKRSTYKTVQLHMIFQQLTCSKPAVPPSVRKHQGSSCLPLGHFLQSGQIPYPSHPGFGPFCEVGMGEI